MLQLLGPNNFPYFSGAIEQLLTTRYFWLQLVCSAVALLQTMAVWLYLGKVPERFWRGLLLALVGFNLLGGLWLQPRLKRLHTITNPPQEDEPSGNV